MVDYWDEFTSIWGSSFMTSAALIILGMLVIAGTIGLLIAGIAWGKTKSAWFYGLIPVAAAVLVFGVPLVNTLGYNWGMF
jgi:hypothetical protein